MKATPLTEQQLVERLKLRYEGDSGNGPGGCVVPQVRNQAGFDASRTIDALGFHFWPSRGLLIDAFECKSSRSDWTRELENPAKADTFCRLADRFYIVAGRSDLVKVEEVPPDWGLLVPSGEKLREVKPATVLHTDSPAIEEWAAQTTSRRARGSRPLPPGFDRSFLIAIIRQAYKVTKVTPEEIATARAQGRAEGEESRQRSNDAYKPMYDELIARVREFENALGYPISGVQWGSRLSPADVGKAVRAVLAGEQEVEGLRNRMNAIVRSADEIAQKAKVNVEALDLLVAAEQQTRLEVA